VDKELDPAALKQPGNGRKKSLPSPEEMLEAFPKTWPKDNPRKALKSSKELEDWCDEKYFDKSGVKPCRDQLEDSGHITVLRGLPHNQMLAGRTAAVKAYQQQEEARRDREARRKRRAPDAAAPEEVEN
jgi:hypothetical protein